MNKDIKALRQQLEQLQKSHREGSVGKKAFEAGKAQLEREILQAVLAAPEAAAAGAQAPRPSRAHRRSHHHAKDRQSLSREG